MKSVSTKSNFVFNLLNSALFLSFFAFSVNNTFAKQNLKPVAQEIISLKQANESFKQVHIFERTIEIDKNHPVYTFAPKAQLLELDFKKLLLALQGNHPHIVLSVPVSPTRTIQLELTQAQILTDDFFVTNAKGRNIENHEPYCQGLYYRGIIQGDTQSLAAVSLFENEVMGVISDNSGNFVLGKLKNKENQYVIYNDHELTVSNPFTCAVNDEDTDEQEKLLPDGYNMKNLNPENLNTDAASQLVCDKVIKVFIHCDYDMYLDFSSSTTNVTNHTTGLYNVVATIYANEQVTTQISQIYVWTIPDPYPDSSSSASLDAFSSQVGSSFNGDLAHLFSTNNNNLGGIAWLNVLCSSSRHAYSNISTTYQNFPTYSWSVNCVTHEMGHNLGSRHTHWCGWAGGAIDNCYDVEGSCSEGPAPVGGGTCMSYCHLTGNGINFNNGFGTLPGNLIRSRIESATCLTSDFASASANGNTSICSGNTVQLLATPTGTGYTYQWKRNGTNITGATSSTYNASLAGNYTVSILSPQSCTSLSNQVAVEVVSGTPTAAFTAGASGVNATFNNTSANAITYSWNFGDPASGANNTSTLKNPVHVFTAAGTYTVTLTATNTCVMPNLQNSTTQTLVIQAFSPCSGNTTLTECNGTITDGSAGQNYNDLQSCSWLISPAGAENILLTFTAFNTEANYDFVKVYDGANASAPLVGNFSGSSIPPPINSTGSSLYITFISDQFVTGAGFDATYNCTLPVLCSGTTTLNSCSGTISDGSGASNYANNMNCSWLISPLDGLPVSLSFVEFDTQSGVDAVSIYNGTTALAPLLGTFSGNSLPSSVVAVSGTMFVVFSSDASVNSAGWKANYSCVPQACASITTLSNCNGVFSDGSGSTNYSNNMNCTWLIAPSGATSITLTFTSFNTEAGYDFVRVYNGSNALAPSLGTFSGTTIPAPVSSTGGSMFVSFTSDQFVVGSGWSANYACTTPGAELYFKALLQGPYNDALGNMNTALAAGNHIGLVQPFNRPPWNYPGTESVASVASNIVDWLLIDLLDANFNVQGRKAAFLRQDGVLTDLDGSQGVIFPGVLAGNYYVVVRSRNHLPIVSNTMVALPNEFASYNFFTASNSMYGASTLVEVSTAKYAMAAGDCYANGVINYRDFNVFFNQVGFSGGYFDADCNMDGSVNLTDFDLFRANAGKLGALPVRY